MASEDKAEEVIEVRTMVKAQWNQTRTRSDLLTMIKGRSRTSLIRNQYGTISNSKLSGATLHRLLRNSEGV